MDHNKLWKILQEMGMPDHLTYLLRNLYAGQEATVRPTHGIMDIVQSLLYNDVNKLFVYICPYPLGFPPIPTPPL